MSQQETPAQLPRPAPQHQEPRESVWSVRRKHADTFFATLFILWIALAAMATAIHLEHHPKPANTQTAEWIARAALDILLKLGPSTIAVVMIAMILNRPLTIAGGPIVITYAAAKERFVYGSRRRREQEQAQAVAQAVDQAVGQAVARANAEWEAWWNRYQEAAVAGEPFNEPPPSGK